MAAWGYEFYLRVLKVSLTSHKWAKRMSERYFQHEHYLRDNVLPKCCNIGTVKPCFMDAHLIWTPHYSGQFALSLGKESLRENILLYKHNEITGELSRENMISSHMKITCYFHMWKYHHCYGYIINRAFHRKKLFQRNGLVFHWCLYNKLIEHYMAAWRYKISLLLLQIFHSFAALTHEIFFNTRREISYLRAAM